MFHSKDNAVVDVIKMLLQTRFEKVKRDRDAWENFYHNNKLNEMSSDDMLEKVVKFGYYFMYQPSKVVGLMYAREVIEREEEVKREIEREK